MPKWARYLIWVISSDPQNAGHTVGKALASVWAFIGAI